jgi:hypothetical protein
VSLVAKQLHEYFDCDKFLQKGDQIIGSCHKIKDKFTNFISRYGDLRPNAQISQISISEEKAEIEEFVIWL